LYKDPDFGIVRDAKIEMLKVMSFTSREVLDKLRDENPGIEFIVRLYDDRIGRTWRPEPQDFFDYTKGEVNRLKSVATLFEIHNEPNHPSGLEGWGTGDDSAVSFNEWFIAVYNLFKASWQGCSFGFPGLAVPHRDFEWLEICRRAIEKADWLGVHCYWQNPTWAESNQFSDMWGLRFKQYNSKFPSKMLHITEFGNSNCQGNYPLNDQVMAREYVDYYAELFKHDCLCSASAFIMSATDWPGFSWRTEKGYVRPVVGAVGKMDRPDLVGWTPSEPAPPPPPIPDHPPVPGPDPEPFPDPEPTPAPEPTPEPSPSPSPVIEGGCGDWVWLPVLDAPFNLAFAAFVNNGLMRYGLYDMVLTLPPEDEEFIREKLRERCR